MANKTCRHCQTEFTGLEVEGDEDGNRWAYLETTPCSHPGCPVNLCSCCPQFECDGCGETFCQDHLREVADLKVCPGCEMECLSYQEEPPRKGPSPVELQTSANQPEVA